MRSTIGKDDIFGKAALEKNLVSREFLARAAVIQKHVFTRTQITPPIGKVLHEMGALSTAQVQLVSGELQLAKLCVSEATEALPTESLIPLCSAFNLYVFEDKLSAVLLPTGLDHRQVEAAEIKQLLIQNGVSYGMISDDQMAHYLAQAQLPDDPFEVGRGAPPVAGFPSEIVYYFDNDPMRIGTLKEDGTMDWKDRGDIPQVTVDQVLAEKVGGDPGRPGIDVHGEEIPPPKIKQPLLKSSKGALRTEDGRRIVAKINGMPKLDAMGRIAVYSILPIDGDVGPETGHVDFDGHVEISGAVTDGYRVKANNLTAAEMQGADVEVSEDLTAQKGIYATTLKVGGNIKASHIHNSTIEVDGNLVVEKEILNCTVEARGKVLIAGGRILSSRICAKKGVFTKDIGSPATRSSELMVGVDLRYEREMKRFHKSLKALGVEKTRIEKNIVAQKAQVDELAVELGKVAQEQDKVMVLERCKQNSEGGLPDQRAARKVTIQDLSHKYNEYDKTVRLLMAQDDQARTILSGLVHQLDSVDKQILKVTQEMKACEEFAKQDPGFPIVKVAGTVYSKTTISGPYKRIILAEDMQRVKICESKDEYQQLTMKISPV
jgi:uncharacterized protein (DUF342 family)